jgi:hypothetical protein
MYIKDINAPYLEKTIFFQYILYVIIDGIKFMSSVLNGVVIVDSLGYSQFISNYITDQHYNLLLEYDVSFEILSTECDAKY